MRGWRLGATLILAVGGCSPSNPTIDYTGLACNDAGDSCGPGWTCVKGSCAVLVGSSSGTTGTRSGAGTTGGTGSAAGSSGASTGTSGAVSSGGLPSSSAASSGTTGGASSGGSSGGSATSGDGGFDAGPPITVGPQVLASGYEYSCAINSAAGVACWGNNLWGNLCNGTVDAQLTPDPLIGISGSIVAIAAGNAHTCAVTAVGNLYCCGGNGNGELGNGTQALIQSTPVQAVSLAGVTAAAAGVAHTCAIAGGGVFCIGYNGVGELGNNTTNSSSIPVQVTGLLTGATAITAGDFHSCAVGPQGVVYCWGSNSNGQLGNGKTAEANAPVTAKGLPYMVSVAAGTAHTCALSGTGQVYCWGRSAEGQLGNQFATGNQTTAVPVTNLTSGVAGISANVNDSCAVTATGAVYCWGDNSYGQLGGGTDAGQSNVPVLIAGLPPGMIAVSAGQYHSCAEAADGGIFCWGYDGYGELGDGQVGNAVAPVPVYFGDAGAVDAGAGPVDGGGYLALSAGWDDVLLLTTSGAVEAWGNDLWGQLGNGSIESSLFPAPVLGLGSGFTAVAGGEYHSCALDSAGNVWGWGDNQAGELGNGQTSSSLVPVEVAGLSGPATAVACGGDHSCAVVGGQLYCWGQGGNGELGNGGQSSSSSPVQVVNFTRDTVVGVTTAQGISCAWTSTGAAYCWGSNLDGLLGDGNTQQETVPTPVTGVASGTTQIAVSRVLNTSEGQGHACAVVGGAVYCWGTDQYGELGDGMSGDAIFSETPVAVVGLDGGVTQVAVGSNHSCALTSAGAMLCWGRGDFGSVGNGTNTSVDTPVPVIDAGVRAITAGELFSCALTDSQLLCWGYGADGELGNGNLLNSNVPVPVQ